MTLHDVFLIDDEFQHRVYGCEDCCDNEADLVALNQSLVAEEDSDFFLEGAKAIEGMT